ncbi:MAG: CPBP family intramembrane metalloprotease [Opitutaceae bacterium]|nr:CPBP family intramembrane metalloprotease [Verrucomicrobiales bacterium]
MCTWANWVPRALVSHGLISLTVPDFMALVAGFGPALAAIILTGVIGGRAGLLRLGERLCRWRVSIQWYAVALFLPAAQAFAALGLHLLFGGELHKPSEVPTLQVGPPDASLWFKVLLLALMFTLGFDGLGEELGWRGFALPRLLTRFSALGGSVLLAGIWALWHLPYALTKGSAMADKPFYAHLLPMLASTILFTWLFNNTRGSILLAILFHAAGNVTVNVLPVLVPGVYASGIWGEIVRWGLVGAVVVIEGPRHLSRKLAGRMGGTVT